MKKIVQWFLDKSNRVVNLILALFVLFIVIAYYINIRSSATNNIIIDKAISVSTDNDPDSLYRFSLPDTLPHRVYQYKMDSINSCSNNLLRNHLLAAGVQAEMGGVGVGKYYECDTTDYSKYRAIHEPDKWETTKYYLKLNDFELVRLDPRFSNDVEQPLFFTNLGFTNMKYLQVDKTVKRNGETPAHFVIKKLKYKVVDMFNATDKTHKEILIPVTKTYYQIFNVFCYIILISLALIFLKVGGFIFFLIEIAKGKAFSVENYKRLYWIAYLIAFIPVFNILPKVIFHWIYSSYYKNEFTIYIDWGKNIKWIFISLLILILAKAFKKGYLIQQEQNLTV
jgi:hypothetical protein